MIGFQFWWPQYILFWNRIAGCMSISELLDFCLYIQLNTAFLMQDAQNLVGSRSRRIGSWEAKSTDDRRRQMLDGRFA